MTSPDIGGHKPRLEYGEGAEVRGSGSSVPRSNQPGYEVGVPVDRGILAPMPGGELPIAQQVAAHYRRVFVGPDAETDPSDERVGAWHGTSVQTLLDATTTGRLRGFSSDQPDAMYQQGDLSVYPTTHLEVPEEILSPETRERMDDATAHYIAYGHAQRIGAEHGFLTNLGIPVTDSESREHAGRRTGARDTDLELLSDEHFHAKGFTDQQVGAAAASVVDVEGVLLGISREVAHDPRVAIVHGFEEEGDVTLRATDGQGVPVDLIAIVQPRGEKDARMLQEGLGEQVDKDPASSDLTAREKEVLEHLSAHEGLPDVELVEGLDVALRTVKDTLRELKSRGLVRFERTKDPTGKFIQTRWFAGLGTGEIQPAERTREAQPEERRVNAAERRAALIGLVGEHAGLTPTEIVDTLNAQGIPCGLDYVKKTLRTFEKEGMASHTVERGSDKRYTTRWYPAEKGEQNT